MVRDVVSPEKDLGHADDHEEDIDGNEDDGRGGEQLPQLTVEEMGDDRSGRIPSAVWRGLNLFSADDVVDF